MRNLKTVSKLADTSCQTDTIFLCLGASARHFDGFTGALLHFLGLGAWHLKEESQFDTIYKQCERKVRDLASWFSEGWCEVKDDA